MLAAKMAVWRQGFGSVTPAGSAFISFQTAPPISGSCMQGFHGPQQRAPAILGHSSLMDAGSHVIVKRLLLGGRVLRRSRWETHLGESVVEAANGDIETIPASASSRRA